MRNWILFIVAVFNIMTIPQGVEGGEKEKTSLGISWPAAAEGWKWDGKEEVYGSRAIFNYIDGAGEVYLAYNFKNLIVRQFEKTGYPHIIAELYDMGSSNDAYGIFSLERQDEEAGIGQGSEFGGGLLRFWKGKFFVSVYADGEGPEVGQAILSLGRAVANSIQWTGQAPKLISALPDGKTGLVETNIRYLHSHILLNQRFFVATRNILNLNPKTEVILAQYLRAGKKIHLLLVRYPDVKEAEAALQSFKRAYMPEVSEKGLLQTEDKKWTAIKKVNEFVLIVFGAGSEREGEELIRGTEKKIGEM
ncbi:MAG: hypothetical protein NT047_04975 [Deltaproteobacteria bacterium]|nr:hypothetical protein [Deltaproteobacteria bacterium]